MHVQHSHLIVNSCPLLPVNNSCALSGMQVAIAKIGGKFVYLFLGIFQTPTLTNSLRTLTIRKSRQKYLLGTDNLFPSQLPLVQSGIREKKHGDRSEIGFSHLKDL